MQIEMKKTIGYISIAFMGAVLALGLNNILAPELTVEPTPQFEVTPTKATLSRSSGPVDLTDAADRSLDAVVHVTTETTVSMNNPLSEFFWGYRPAPRQQQGAGSGVILSNDGHIVTNNHVVANADKIMIHTNDRKSYPAVVVGRDPSTDIALLKIEESGLPYMELGNSDVVEVGEWVLAVGNPFNLTSTVTAGIVSAKARNINLLRHDPENGQFPLESFIQTDAAVNPGNSGGALVNENGQLIGINTAIASQTGSYAGYSFAIPVNLVAKVTNDLMEYGSVQRAFIGVNIRSMNEELAETAGMGQVKGVYVSGLTENGAALKAGLEIGDVITKVGDIPVNTVPALQEQIGNYRPGDSVELTVFRKSGVRSLDVELLDKDGNNALRKQTNRITASLYGADIEQVSQAELAALNLSHGVKVTRIRGGKFQASGIKEGFVIVSVDRTPIQTPESMRKLLQSSKGGVLVEGVYPNGTRAYYGLGT